jgi:hypothetical protein
MIIIYPEMSIDYENKSSVCRNAGMQSSDNTYKYHDIFIQY